MAVNWTKELAEQLNWYWVNLFRPRLEGLTDEEYFWEPVANCWTLRPDDTGAFHPDWEYPTPDPAPVTTIAWRLSHIGGQVLGMRASSHFGDGSITLETLKYPGTAAAAMDFLEKAYTEWQDGVRGLDEQAFAAPCGPAEGPYGDYPMATLVLHINREVFHHAAEVALLRDLYQARTE